MTNENSNTAAVVASALALVIGEQKPQNIEAFLVRRGTFATVDFQLTYTRFEQRAEAYAAALQVVRMHVLESTDTALVAAKGRRLRVPDMVSSIINGLGVEPGDESLKDKKEHIESIILSATSDNDVEAKYHRIQRGKNAGICRWADRE